MSATAEPSPRTRRPRALIVLLAAVMAVTVFPGPSLGILSRFIIDDVGISRTQLGFLATGAGLSGALLGPYSGQLADRVGGRTALLVAFGLAAAGLLAIALAPGFPLLVLAVALGGVASSGSNPASNKLIGLHFPAGRRGLVTGIKQSGVQIGIFLGGLTLPVTAEAYGWRIALSVWSVIALVALVSAAWIVPRDVTPRGPTPRSAVKSPVSPAIRWLALDGILNGAVVASALTYLPLYAQEEGGMSVTTAGAVASAFALSGLASRLGWTHFAETSANPARPLVLVAAFSTTGIALLWLAQIGGAWLIWVGAIVVATAQAWNAIAMLAVIDRVDPNESGRSSGTVARGFGLGLALGPPVFGFLVDSTGGYGAAFAFLLVVGTGAGLLMLGSARLESR